MNHPSISGLIDSDTLRQIFVYPADVFGVTVHILDPEGNRIAAIPDDSPCPPVAASQDGRPAWAQDLHDPAVSLQPLPGGAWLSRTRVMEENCRFAEVAIGPFRVDGEPFDPQALRAAPAAAAQDAETDPSITCLASERALALIRHQVGLCNLLAGLCAEKNRLQQHQRQVMEAEQARLIAERNYQAIFNGVRDAIFVENLDSEIIDANATACEMYGYTLEEFRGMPVQFLVVPGHTIIMPHTDGHDPSSPVETMNVRKDGTVFPVELTFRDTTLNGKPIMLVVVRDISARKEAETIAQETQTRLSEAQHLAHLGNYEFEMPSGVVKWSEETYHITRRDPALGPPSIDEYYQMIYPADLAHLQQVVEQAVADGNPFNVEYRIRTPDGEIRYVQSLGRVLPGNETNPTRVFGTLLDITQRKRAEERLKITLEATSDALWDWDLLSGRHFFSPRWSQMLGFEDNELESNFNTWFQLVHPDDREAAMDAVNAHLEGRSPVYLAEFRMRTREGDWRWILSRGQIIERAPSGQPLRMIGVHFDITERRRIEAELVASEERFYKAFQTSPDSVTLHRISDGTTIDVNEGFTLLSGFTREEAVGKTASDLGIWAYPEDRERFISELWSAGQVNNLECRMRAKNGEVRFGQISARKLELNGEASFICILRDVTERKHNENEIRRAHEELEEAYQATLESWVRALALRDPATHAHSRQVLELTVMLAGAMGIPEDQMVHIQRGALLHDIGKLVVPDQILNKPGALTPEEWAVMRRHPEIAYTLLWPIPYLRPSLDIPYCHHEHWDGSGYPRGLKGEEIPLAARIFIVADVWDALSSRRAYRDAWSETQICAYLQEKSGSIFDPVVVAKFLELIR